MSRKSALLAVFCIGCITELPVVERPCEVWDKPGIYDLHVDAGGLRRKAYVYMPASEGPRELVFALHGAGSEARYFSEITNHIALSNREGFVVVYPQGRAVPTARGWNAGSCCGPLSEDNRDIDDIAFMEELAKVLEERTCTNRVLATGFSNGGMLSHRWACEQDTVDAVVPTGGGIAFEGACKGDPMPIRHYHGALDERVPVEGDENHQPLADTMATWRKRNQCEDAPPTLETNGPMTCQRWACAAPTELCIVDGWAHKYPGGTWSSQLGGIDATIEGWNFFLDNVPGTSASATYDTEDSGVVGDTGESPTGGTGI